MNAKPSPLTMDLSGAYDGCSIPRTVRTLCLGLLVSLGLSAADQAELFEKKVRPIFAAKCQGCHSGASAKAGLDLSSGTGFRRGTDSGPVLDSSQPDESRLLKAVGYLDRVKMPPAGKLADAEITSIQEWVRSGAPWPGVDSATSAAPRQAGYSRALREFWSFRPVQKATPPAVNNPAWARNEIDPFLHSKLEEQGLGPAPEADKATLLRRATFDLIGLPPTESEIRAFLADESPTAFERVVDRLLSSPRYGEKWGRHWLDVSRYADSTGADEDHRYPYAWRYRDYVINAFNEDIPYDRFVREQIAGDLLPSADGKEVNVRGIVATGFLALGPKLIAEQDKVKMLYDIIDEQIEVSSKVVLGLTIACARCHDHKFDPISTKDYYALASIFASSKNLEKLEGTVSQLYFAPLSGKAVTQAWEAHKKRIEEKQKEIDGLTGEEARIYRDGLATQLAGYMLAARAVYEGNEKLEDAARKRKFDAAVLERWIAYLKPTRERRVHLETWHKAPRAEWNAVAAKYQKDFITTATMRKDAQAAWKREVEIAKVANKMPPPAPQFFAGDDRYFTEVTSGKGPFALPEKDKERVFTDGGRNRYTRLQAELKAIKDTVPPEPLFACGLAEGPVVDQPVFHRGSPDAKGEIVPKRFPLVLAGEHQPPIAHGSGRKELADWLSSASNPLPARVMVNRIWQGHFGQGLVRTPSNFGVVGERPSHPELLDWLASEFIARGWSMKAMHRLMMLSSAYRMSSETSDLKRERDPDNRLLSRFSMRRLTIEEMRDSLLQIDGTLDLAMGGTLQSGDGTDKEFSDGRKSLDPAQSKRRTVYLPLRRSNLPSILNLFDFGDATTHNEARSQTNVAPQALFMMNSGFAGERAKTLAERLSHEGGSDREKIERGWLLVLGRLPDQAQVGEAFQYLEKFPGSTTLPDRKAMAWTSYCKTLISSNDYLYVH